MNLAKPSALDCNKFYSCSCPSRPVWPFAHFCIPLSTQFFTQGPPRRSSINGWRGSVVSHIFACVTVSLLPAAHSHLWDDKMHERRAFLHVPGRKRRVFTTAERYWKISKHYSLKRQLSHCQNSLSSLKSWPPCNILIIRSLPFFRRKKWNSMGAQHLDCHAILSRIAT